MPAENHTTLTPDTPVRYLKGVGPKTAERFEKLGIVTLADLLCHYPRKYIDFTKPYSIAEAPADTECVVKAEVFAKPGGRILPGGRRMERVTAGDDVSGLEITWFNNPYAAQKLEIGQEYYFQGIVTGGMLRRQMVNPLVRTAEQVQAAPFEAVYPQTEGLSSSAIAKCVRQRGMLAEKAVNPHLLVMSATPIPRTLGLLLYGDLDISILDELPPGRTPVKTRCITGKKRRDLYHFLDQEIDKGRQVYLVCPAIEDTPDGGLNAVKTYYEDIAKALLPDRRVGLMHGKLKPKEKAAVMEDFKAGRLDALVSTTVIEVGVDVPNASVMVIENAERYGLSALHQLRGRVGRGAAESWCFLVSDNTGEAVQKRLKFLCSTTDGFAVAQYDLETRGPGDFFGSRQHGLPTLQIADLMNDTRTLHAAQSEALAMLAEDPLLQAPEHALLAAQVQQMFDKAGAMN